MNREGWGKGAQKSVVTGKNVRTLTKSSTEGLLVVRRKREGGECAETAWKKRKKSRRQAKTASEPSFIREGN